ncbi:MAG: MFS transporter [Alphaproteobacteria bacterium]|nr:MFS transporter [Alphaproteobacteria bacterium]
MKRSYLTVLICAATLLTVSVGIRQGLGLFLKPISLDLGVGREVFAFAMALQNLLWGAAAPFAGGIADKYGTGRTLAVSALFYAAGLYAMAISTGSGELFLGSILLGLGLSGLGFSVALGAVGRAAPPEKRSMALGICAAGGSFGQFIMVPYGEYFLSSLGWSSALMVLAATSLIMVPLSAGVAGQQASAADQDKQSLMAALKEAAGHRGFQLLTAGFFVCGFQVVFVAVHLPSYLADLGIESWVAAWCLALVGLFNIIGSYSAGVLGSKFRKKYVLAWIYLGRSLVFLVFILMPLTSTSALVFASALGLLWLSTIPLTSGLIAQVFGPTYMSMLYGVVFFSHQVGSFLGAWLGGYFFDVFGSYDAMWVICIGLGFFAAAMHYPITDQPMTRLSAKGAAA